MYRAFFMAGTSKAARIAMMAITTSSSIRVKARFRPDRALSPSTLLGAPRLSEGLSKGSMVSVYLAVLIRRPNIATSAPRPIRAREAGSGTCVRTMLSKLTSEPMPVLI